MATDIGIDIGSSKTVIFSSSKVLFEQPNVVTVDSDTWLPVYFGEKAKQTQGRTPESLMCINPIERGVISDYEIAETMLKNYMTECLGNKVLRPKIMATLPAGLTELQHHSLQNVIEGAGGRNVFIIESPLAVAFGLDLDFTTPRGALIVDVGAGSTDIAVVSMGGISVCESFKTASFDIDNQIIRYVKREYNIEIGNLTAENIKIKIGAAVKRPVEIAMVVKGQNVFTGLPESFEITADEIYEAISDTVNAICNAVREVINKTDPDLVSDICEDGLYLCGGGSLLAGFDKKLSEYLGISVNMLPDPSYSVVKGAAAALKNPDMLKNVDYRMRSIKELEIE